MDAGPRTGRAGNTGAGDQVSQGTRRGLVNIRLKGSARSPCSTPEAWPHFSPA